MTDATFTEIVGPEIVIQTAKLDKLVQAKFAPPSYGLLKNVGDGTGARQYRWADWLAMGLWPSRGLTLIGIECKVSRTDWLKELKTPEKAEAIAQYCDEWYLAVGDKNIVKPGELPKNWGLLVPTTGGLKVSVPATTLTPLPISRGFLAAVFRRCMEQAVDAAVVKQANEDGYERGRKHADDELARLMERHKELEERIEAFAKSAGIDLYDLIHGWTAPEKFGDAFRKALNPIPEVNRSTFKRIRIDAQYAMQLLSKVLERTAWLDDEPELQTDEEP